MTGGEIAAAAVVGKVVKHAGKELAKDSNSIRKELTEQAMLTPEFAAAARSKATRIAIRQGLLTKMYQPLAKMAGLASLYYENDFEKDMAAKLADVPDENIVAPKPSIAAPAMQQLAFSLDEPDLKDLYLSLLATASDDRAKDGAHPSFVEVIKQLSASEIPFLEAIVGGAIDVWSIVQLKLKTEGAEGHVVLAKHVMQADPLNIEASRNGYLSTYIDNWVRLGLVEVQYDSFKTAPDAYAWVAESEAMFSYQQHFSTDPARTIEFDKGILRRTDYARTFARAVGMNS